MLILNYTVFVILLNSRLQFIYKTCNSSIHVILKHQGIYNDLIKYTTEIGNSTCISSSACYFITKNRYESLIRTIHKGRQQTEIYLSVDLCPLRNLILSRLKSVFACLKCQRDQEISYVRHKLTVSIAYLALIFKSSSNSNAKNHKNPIYIRNIYLS